MLNLDTFRTSGRRLRAGSDADVTDVSTRLHRDRRDHRNTAITLRVGHEATSLRRHELQHVTWDFFRSPSNRDRTVH